MNLQYRVYLKNEGRYATADELEDIYLRPNGKVWNVLEGYYHKNITDDVVVELGIGATDTESIPPKQIHDGDKLLVGYEDCEQRYDEDKDEYIDSEIYIVQYQIDMQYPAFDLVPLPGENNCLAGCGCSPLAYILADGRCKVVGTIHSDESEAGETEPGK